MFVHTFVLIVVPHTNTLIISAFAFLFVVLGTKVQLFSYF